MKYYLMVPSSAENYAPELSGSADGGNAMRNLRNLVAACGIDRLIADSKFFPDETLVCFVTAIAAQISRSTLVSVNKKGRATRLKGNSTIGAEFDVAAYHNESLPPLCSHDSLA